MAADTIIDAATDRLVLDRVAEEVRDQRDRAAVRRAVARGLAAAGIVVSPARWATLVRAYVEAVPLPVALVWWGDATTTEAGVVVSYWG